MLELENMLGADLLDRPLAVLSECWPEETALFELLSYCCRTGR